MKWMAAHARSEYLSTIEAVVTVRQCRSIKINLVTAETSELCMCRFYIRRLRMPVRSLGGSLIDSVHYNTVLNRHTDLSTYLRMNRPAIVMKEEQFISSHMREKL